MDFNLAERTIFLTVTGSHAYGTSTTESDIDVRGIAVAPLSYASGFLNKFEQARHLPESYWAHLSKLHPHYRGMFWQQKKMEEVKTTKDSEVMDLRKFCRLATDANPNVLELLYIPLDFFIYVRKPMMDLLEVKSSFLSRKVHDTFSGYALSQFKKIRRHRRWLRDPPKKKPERSDFGLTDQLKIPRDQWKAAESLIERRIQDWTFHPDEEIPITVLERVREAMTDMVASVVANQDPEITMMATAGRQLGFSDNFMEMLAAEKRFRGAVLEWAHFQDWVAKRNPVRHELEAKFSYDTKHASHVVRIVRMGEELLNTGKFSVYRPDADELLAIRRGAWSYEKLEDFANTIGDRLHGLASSPNCPLPKDPDSVKIDEMCSRIVEKWESFP